MKKNFEIEKAILLGRGIKNYEKFLNPSVDKLNNPLLLADGKRAAKRILEAIKNREKICIFGHDDVDGITSTVILYRYLTKLGSEKISYYIPNREYEKYGIQKPFLDKILKENVKLIITVDSGINELDAIDFLNKQKIDSIILDHHIIYKEIPKAFAVVNPKRKDCKFPFNMLAGVGVVFNILKIIEKFQEENIENLYIILTGLGTISDRMPLIDDNRIFSKYIFENIKKSENTFLKFFIDENRNLSKQKKIKHLIKILTMGRDENGVHFGVDILLEEEILKVKEIYQILQNRLVNNNKEIDE
nr:DHH family phosphoesterase [Candidatus Cloacimonadota bacterium]